LEDSLLKQYYKRFQYLYFLSRAFWKLLVTDTLNLDDFEAVAPTIYLELMNICEYNLTDIGLHEEVFELQLRDEQTGTYTKIPLKEGGSNIKLCEENKFEYLKLRIKHQLFQQTLDVFHEFLKGFYSFIPRNLIQIFSYPEIQVLACGEEIDIDDWESKTTYEGCNRNNEVIQWFWDIVRESDKSTRVKVFEFVAATVTTPAGGFGKMTYPFTIQMGTLHSTFYNQKNSNCFPLPQACTCFCRLKLYNYPDKETLKEKLMLAIDSRGFHLE